MNFSGRYSPKCSFNVTCAHISYLKYLHENWALNHTLQVKQRIVSWWGSIGLISLNYTAASSAATHDQMRLTPASTTPGASEAEKGSSGPPVVNVVKRKSPPANERVAVPKKQRRRKGSQSSLRKAELSRMLTEHKEELEKVICLQIAELGAKVASDKPTNITAQALAQAALIMKDAEDKVAAAAEKRAKADKLMDDAKAAVSKMKMEIATLRLQSCK